MVFDIKPPAGSDWAALRSTFPIIFTYVMSFLYLGIYWNNHHHLYSLVTRINGSVLSANLHLLFWLSLFPFTTPWLSFSDFECLPTALYGTVLLLAAVAYLILQEVLIRAQRPDTHLQEALGVDWKGKCSPLLYAVGIATAFVQPRWSMVLCSVPRTTLPQPACAGNGASGAMLCASVGVPLSTIPLCWPTKRSLARASAFQWRAS